MQRSNRFAGATRRGGLLLTALALVVVAGVMGLLSQRSEAHKAITSKFTYNQDVFPIVKERCARCHYEGGPTPMALTTYKDAVPWAESIREQLVGEMMPPWYADPAGPAVKAGHTISTRELDTLVTWAVGGAPQGPIGTDPAPYVPPAAQWRAGKPDLTIATTEHVVKSGTTEESVELTLPTGLKEAVWVKAMDMLPGAPSMVRSAVVSIESGEVLGTWVPGHDATPAPSGAAFKVPAGAKLRVQLHYRKHYTDEQADKADTSTIGLYFTEAPLSGRSIQALQVDSPLTEGDMRVPRTFSAPLKSAARIVALRPSFDQSYESVTITANVGTRKVTLMKLRAAQPQWYRRYWLAEPIEVPAGATIEVKATPKDNEFAMITQKKYPLALGVDYVPQ